MKILPDMLLLMAYCSTDDALLSDYEDPVHRLSRLISKQALAGSLSEIRQNPEQFKTVARL